MSSVAFDPYHKWLGIPKSDQPAHHYRLLGIPVFEDDLQVIEGAADRQMAFLRKFQSGEHSADALKLLNEISRARLCLLKPDTKAAYDADLRSKLTVEPPVPDTPATKPVWQQTSVLGGAAVAVVLLAVTVMMLSTSRKPAKPDTDTEGQGGVAKVPETSPEALSKEAKQERNPSVPKDAVADGTKKKTSTNQEDPADKGDQPRWPTLTDGDPDTKSDPSTASEKSTEKATGKTKPPTNAGDLLAALDIDRDRIQGSWKKEQGKLISPVDAPFAALQLPTATPDEFDLVAELTRISGEGSLLLGFPVQGNQSGVAIDGWGGSTSGLETIDGEHPDTHPDHYSGSVLPTAKRIKVVCQIRTGSVTVEAAGKRIVEWQGPPTLLSVDSKYRLRLKPSLVIGSRDAEFAISRLELVPVKPLARPRSEPGPDSVDLLSRINIGRDSAAGEWQSDGGILIGKVDENAEIGRLNVPYRLTPQYDLVLTVERQVNRGSLLVGLPVQGNQCVVVLDTGGRNDLSGLSQIDGKLAHQNATTKRVKVLPGGESVALTCRVRRNHVVVESNGSVIIDWQGNASLLSAPDVFPFVNPNEIMLGLQGGAFRITELRVTPARDAGPAIARTPSGSGNGNPERTTVEGSLEITKLPTPPEDAQDAARKKIRETFKIEYGLAKKSETKNLEPRIALARSLFSKAQDSDDDPAACYVLMSEAADYAASAGQLGLAWEILQALGERFEATPLPLMLQAAKDAKPFAKSPEEITVLGAMYAMLLEAAIQADDFETATKAAQEANTISRKIPVLKEQLSVWGRRVNQLREVFAAIKPASETLKANPADETANLTWGRYVCFYKGEWTVGLPFLAKSADTGLAALAKSDLEQSRSVEALEQLGDGWWAIAEKEKEPAKSIVGDHAAEAWQMALPFADSTQRQALENKIGRTFGVTKKFVTTGSGNGTAVTLPDLDPGPFFTVEFWVNTRATDGVLISKRHKAQESSIVLTLEKGRPVIGGDSVAGFDKAKARVAINDGRWHHVAAVKVGSRLGLFVDGKSVAQTDALPSYRSASPWKVGHQENSRYSELEATFSRLRFSKEARYLVNFIPEKTYAKDKATLFIP